MHPPPDPSILQKLVSHDVECVSFGKYTAHLSLDDGSRVSFEAPFRFGPAADLANDGPCEFPLISSSLMRIVGHSVTSAECEDDGTLWLTFDNGDTLVVYANNPMYEAYTVLVEGREYVV